MKILSYKYIFFIFFVETISSTAYAQHFTPTFLTFNIRYDGKSDTINNWQSRKGAIVSLINHYEPSVFGIQEGLLNQVTYIDSSLNKYQYIGAGRDNGFEKGEYCAIFFDRHKYVVLQTSTFWLSEIYDKPNKGWDAALPRICTYGLFEDMDTKAKFFVFNTHFDHVGKIAREKSAYQILEWIQVLNHEHLPVILMGDFNSEPDEKPIEILSILLKDALQISQKPLYGPSGTFNGFTKDPVTRRIDYFFTQDVEILDYAHIDDVRPDMGPISDHLPVLIRTMDFLPR
ncbi:MAG: endonuclease/exonuclease/phosphatase family protein [Saprospiraceae bacterium]|nr:endonuclease/exonuclease/phosphatase family protein [Saprospiraceae bacterium]